MDCKTDEDFQRAVNARHQGISNVVSVSVPAEAYYNIDRMQEIQRTLLGKLGHQACVSGWDLRFDLIRQYVVDDKMQVVPGGGFAG